MASDIDSYIRELQGALAGADPALIQDAVFDAEEHLRAEMATEIPFEEIVEHYGSPEEVASAYLGTSVSPVPPVGVDAETTTGTEGPTGMQLLEHDGDISEETVQPPLPVGVQAGLAAAAQSPEASQSVLHQVFGVFVDPSVYKALLYMIISLATGVAYFTVVVTGLSTAAGLLVLIIGLPFLLLVLGIVRGMALFEGRLVELLLDTRMPRRPRAEPPDAGFFQRMSFWIKDGRTWASIAYMLLMLPLGIVYFTIAITGLALGLGLIFSPFWAWLGDYSLMINGIAYHWWFPFWGVPVAIVCGFLVLLAWFHVVRWIGRGHAAFAKAMLVRLAK